ncbi:hypothetical protein E2C01_073588 [Portunus trituberculatus]|uniref:Uncharacterized protein n=1 Tax=Portunus trituberculatus TaxID=210409 RepID=A0A5B7IAZ8_PORTR|nr:hypothetical protein [Portunus trituberculatus]
MYRPLCANVLFSG